MEQQSKNSPHPKQPVPPGSLELTHRSGLVKPLQYERLEPSANRECDLCSGDRFRARYWCPESEKYLCPNCRITHQSLLEHESLSYDELRAQGTQGMCTLHEKEENSYCDRCFKYFCDTCYKDHCIDPPKCLFQFQSIEEEASKRKSKISESYKEMQDLNNSLKNTNRKIRNFTKELKSDCDLKCKQAWENHEEMVEYARLKTVELCEEIKQQTAEQVKRWRLQLRRHQKILKQLKTWLGKLGDSSKEPLQNIDDVRLAELESKLLFWRENSIENVGRCQLLVTSPDWLMQTLKQLQSERIGSVSMKFEKNYTSEGQFPLRGSNSDVTTIQISEEDGNIFVCDYKRKSVSEFTNQGELVHECLLTDGKNKFAPFDMCILSQNTSIVVCGQEQKMIFLERMKDRHFEIRKIIETNREFLSVCKVKESLFVCDHFFHIDLFSTEGEKIKTISRRRESGGFWPRIRADPSTGNFWATKLGSTLLECFNSNGEKLRSVEIDTKITDFCVGKFDNFCYCNHGGLFTFSPRSILKTFEKKSECDPMMFCSRNKIFVCLKRNGGYSIEMLKEIEPKQILGNSERIEKTMQLEMIVADPSSSGYHNLLSIPPSIELDSEQIYPWQESVARNRMEKLNYIAFLLSRVASIFEKEYERRLVISEGYSIGRFEEIEPIQNIGVSDRIENAEEMEATQSSPVLNLKQILRLDTNIMDFFNLIKKYFENF